jgi:cold shock CspA family protein
MAKSKETFNKKEKEKKKLKKKKDKEQRKEIRRSEGNKSFEQMIAYVDAFGNITDVPPSAQDRVEINADDILLGAANDNSLYVEDSEGKGGGTHNGTVIFFNTTKGYGFIKDDKKGESVFVHIHQVEGEIKENMKVTFNVEQGNKGLVAVKVRKI